MGAENSQSLVQLLAQFKKTQDTITKELLPQIFALLASDNKMAAPQYIYPHSKNWRDRLEKRNIIRKRQSSDLEVMSEDIFNSIKQANEIIAHWRQLREHCVELIKERLK